MSLIKWNPWPEQFEGPLDKFVWGDFPAVANNFSFTPSIDIYQDNDNVVVEAPLAGIKPENVKLSIENDVLTIEGKAEQKSEIDEKEYYRKEIRSGSFYRSVALPVAVDGAQAKAEYENGILKVIIPKEERVKSKNIEIEVKKK